MSLSVESEQVVNRRRGSFDRPASTVENKFRCAVSGCPSVNGSLNGDRLIMFFDPPTTEDHLNPAARATWFKAIPSLSTTAYTQEGKVCDAHFVDGMPTTENPAPTLQLGGRKRSVNETASDEAPIFGNGNSRPIDSVVVNGSQPPRKVIRTTSGAPAVLKWRTPDGAPKQLSFDKPGEKRVVQVAIGQNGVVRKTFISRPTTSAQAAASPVPNLASMLAGIVPEAVKTAQSTTPRVVQVTAPPQSNRLPPSTSNVGIHECRVTDAACPRCIATLPHLRKSLGRLETRMDAVTSMVKQLVSRHPQTLANTITVPLPKLTMQRPTPTGQSTITVAKSRVFIPKLTARPLVSSAASPTTSAPSKKEHSMPRLTANKETHLTPSSFMHNMIAKGVLLYRAAEFTAEEYLKNAPNAVKAFSERQVMEVITNLIRDGLIKKVDDSVSSFDPECIFEKEQDKSKLGSLTQYGITVDNFLLGCDSI